MEFVKGVTDNVKNLDGKVKIEVAKASYDEYDKHNDSSKINSSNLVSKGNILINSQKDTNIIGSNLNAKENIQMTAI